MRKLIHIYSIVIAFMCIWIPLRVVHAGVISKAPNNNGLVGYWSFNEGTSTTAGDFSGNGYSGSFPGGAANPTWTTGKYGSALDFTLADNDRVNIGSVSALNATNLTMCAWIYPRSAANYPNIFSNISGTDGFDFYLNDATHIATSFGTGAYVLGSGIEMNKWQFVCAVHNGSTYSGMSVYINGVDVTSTYSAGADKTPGTGASYIGNDSSSTYDFDGKIDEFRFYNRVLSSAEIMSLYKSGLTVLKKRIGYVQKATNFNSTGSSVSSLSTSSFTPSNGNFIAVHIKHEGLSTTATVTDTLGNVFYPLTYINHSNGDLHSQWFYAKNIKGGTDTITATFGASRPYVSIAAFEYSGISLSSPYDVQTYSQGTGFAMTTSNVTTQGKYLALLAASEYNAQTYTSSAPWTEIWDCRQENVNCGGGAVSERIGTDKETISGAMTQVGNYDWILDMIVFKLNSQTINSSQNSRLTNGLVGLWSFNGPDISWSSNIAYDRSGQGNNGTITNMSTSTSPTIGKVGQALSFDGVNDNINLGRLSSTEGASQLTWSFWAYTNTFQSGDAFISKEDVFNTGSWQIGISTGCNVGNQLIVYIAASEGDGSKLGCADIPSPATGRWIHYAVVYDGTATGNANRLKIYIDGVQDATLDFIGTIPASTIVSTDNVRIGSNSVGNLNLNGKIDEVRIYNRALSATEVKQLYLMGN